MFANKFLGWSSAVVVAIAGLLILSIVAFMLFPTALPFIKNINAQALLIFADAFALIAALLGFFSRQTTQGKIGAITGVVLFIAITLLISFTFVTATKTQIGAAQLQSLIGAV